VGIHNFTTLPTNQIGTTANFTIPSGNSGWYTLPLTCPLVLTPGDYLLGVHETGSPISIGTTPFNYLPNTGYTIFSGNPWRTLEYYGYPVTLLLRANFGGYNLTVNAGTGSSDSTCTTAGPVSLTNLITGNDPGGVWFDDNMSGGLTGSTVNPAVTGPGTFTFSYNVTDNCNIADTAQVTLVVVAGPNAGQNGSATVCSNDAPIDLASYLGTADPGGTWNDNNSSGALTGSIFSPQVAGTGTYNFTYTVAATSLLCNDDSALVVVNVQVCPAIDPSVPLSFSIYPNPNQGNFRLEAPGSVGQNLEIRVTDLAGRVVYREAVYNASGTMSIDLGEVSRGMYIVELSDGEARTQGRLIKE
jgi:hypothetical protein